MNKIDQYLKSLIQSHLALTNSGRPEVLGFPDVEDYCRFLEGVMDLGSEKKMPAYLSAHPETAIWLASVRELYQSNKGIREQKVPLGLELKAKNLMYPKKGLDKKNYANLLYLSASIVAFILSFILKRYFVQCVAVAVVLAFKWIIEEKNRKTQILIYKSIQETQTQTNSRDLHHTKSDL